MVICVIGIGEDGINGLVDVAVMEWRECIATHRSTCPQNPSRPDRNDIKLESKSDRLCGASNHVFIFG